MEKNKKKDELQSRRQFFKKAAKGALPILGAIALTNAPFLINAHELESTNSCNNGCSYMCQSYCSRSCTGSCKGSCEGRCNVNCSNSCARGCQYTCNGYSSHNR